MNITVSHLKKKERRSPSKNAIDDSDGVLGATNDELSDRIRCDYPQTQDGEVLADTLIQSAEELGRGKIITIVTDPLPTAMIERGFRVAAKVPDLYEGKEDVFIMSYNVDENRLDLANPKEVGRVEALLKGVEFPQDLGIENLKLGLPISKVEVATSKNAEEIAQLIADTFPDYPTPSFDPNYIKQYIEAGNLFHFIRGAANEMVACASADLVTEAKTAELTDCATRPSYRGRGYMRAILISLMQKLESSMGYPTAFTMARARIPGINILFKQLGFHYCGRLSKSCHIGDGLEDMNIWARRLY
jgi:beta-lysine N6-acetyltransferase